MENVYHLCAEYAVDLYPLFSNVKFVLPMQEMLVTTEGHRLLIKLSISNLYLVTQTCSVKRSNHYHHKNVINCIEDIFQKTQL